MSGRKKKLPPDTTWPPTGGRDLKPDVPVRDKADPMRFSTLRDALERTTAPGAPISTVTPDTLTEPLVHDMLRRAHSRSVEYLCRAYLQFGKDALRPQDLEGLCAAINTATPRRQIP